MHMTAQRTDSYSQMGERQKALERLVLLTVVGLVCLPPVTARSGTVWALYLVVLVLYFLWTLRLTRGFSADRWLGYLLCLTDGAMLVPLLVWSPAAAMRIVLVFVWAAGLAATYYADRALRRSARAGGPARLALEPRLAHSVETVCRKEGAEAPLERALRVRLRVFDATKTRFALVLLRVTGHEEMTAYYGDEAAQRMLAAISRKGLRLLGPDAQLFLLPGGRMAFVFATDTAVGGSSSAEGGSLGWIDPYDVESLAMALGRRACEQTIDGHPWECVVGWASAPADGVSADDLMYTAESGAQSTAAFRRVGGVLGVPMSEKTRALAG